MTEYVDLWQEHCDYEANAQFDYVREAYYQEAQDCLNMALEDERFEKAMMHLIGPLEDLYIQFHWVYEENSSEAIDFNGFDESGEAVYNSFASLSHEPVRRRVYDDLDMPF